MPEVPVLPAPSTPGSFDPNDVWIRAAAETPHLRQKLFLEQCRKLATALRLYPQRLPTLLLDKRAIDRWQYSEGALLGCSLGHLQVDNANARAQLREILISGAYAAPGFIPTSGWNVVDVGANLGFFSLWAASFMRRGSMLAIEAIPETFEVLRRNMDAIKRPGVTAQALNIAVTDSRRSLEFAVPDGYSNYARSAQHLGRLASFPNIRRRQIQGDSLDEILRGQQFPSDKRPRIDLLKIDVEGSEVECLSGATHTLDRTDRVVLEYHSLDLLAESSACLAQAGFKNVLSRRGFLGGELGVVFWRRALPGRDSDSHPTAQTA